MSIGNNVLVHCSLIGWFTQHQSLCNYVPASRSQQHIDLDYPLSRRDAANAEEYYCEMLNTS